MAGTERYELGGVDLARLPKISLHDHLDGGLRPATIIDLAEQAGVELPAATPAALAAWIQESADSGDLVEYLRTFDLTVGVMQTAEALRRVAREAVLDLAADGVIYGELRWAPELHLERGLTLEQAVEAVRDGIEAGQAEVRRRGGDIRVTQILCAMRQQGRSLEIARLAVRNRDLGVVGFDLAGPEEGYPPGRHAEAFAYLSRELFPVTVHAGEAAGLDSVRDAVVTGRALRLGHGVRLMDDVTVERDEEGLYGTLGVLASWVRDRGIAIECCVTSNLQTGALGDEDADAADHPIDLFYEMGMRVTVNVDNRLMSGTTLTREFALLADAFDYDLADFEVLTLNAVEGAFLPQPEREELAERVSAAYDGIA